MADPASSSPVASSPAPPVVPSLSVLSVPATPAIAGPSTDVRSRSNSTSSEAPSPSGRHVEYILLAEFDIDKGSVLRHQYPKATGVSENSLAELMLPEGAHLRETDFTVFFLKYSELKDFPPHEPEEGFGSVLAPPSPPPPSAGPSNPPSGPSSPPSVPSSPIAAQKKFSEDDGFLCCLNVVRTKMDASVRRGAVVKAIAICTQHRFFHIFKPLLLLALDKYFETPDVKVLQRVYQSINNMDLSELPTLSGLDLRVIRASRLRFDSQAPSGPLSKIVSKIHWSETTTIPVRVQTGMEPDEVGEASLVALINLFKEATMTIFTAIFAEKRVLFLGHNQPARDVCNHVLSACLLVSPPLFGTLKRAYPYANLTNLDFLTVPGYIAGVTNPIFEARQQWWDVLCNIQTGDVLLSENYRSALEASAIDRTQEVDSALISKIMSGVGLKYGEEWVRCMFRDYTTHLVSMAYDEEQYPNEAAKALSREANSFRLRLFLHSQQFKRHDQYRQRLARKSPFRAMDSVIRNHVRSLQVRSIPDDEIKQIIKDLLRYVQSKDELLELLAMLPESEGGLSPLAVNLFHHNHKVREGVVQLLKRLDDLQEGMSCVSSLNYFLLLTYNRFSREMNPSLLKPVSAEDADEDEDDKDDDDGEETSEVRRSSTLATPATADAIRKASAPDDLKAESPMSPYPLGLALREVENAMDNEAEDSDESEDDEDNSDEESRVHAADDHE